jgi:acyl-CoA thioester hydrolase
MHYQVVSRRHAKVAAEGDGRIVSYDYHAQTKAPLPEVIVARIHEREGARLAATP